MKKKQKGGGGANWMDTYGDMVTLLLCFFVLLYSMSTISEENWKAIVMSFNPFAKETITVTPGGNGPDADANEAGGPVNMTQQQAMIDADIDQLYEELKAYVEQAGEQTNISVAKDGGKVYISFNQMVFFDGDSPVLKKEAEPILTVVSDLFSKVAESIDEIRVLGHTAQADPNRPNGVERDRTLSSQRATNVVIFVQQHSTVDPARLVSEGVGQWKPIDTNDTPEGRSRNRRVEMIVSGRNLAEELEGGIPQYVTK